MLNFDFLQKGLGIVSSMCMIFQEKCFSCYALLTDQISLPDCLHFLWYWSICVLQGCDVINFEIDLLFLIKQFFETTEISRQKFKYLENEKSFEMK